MQIAVNYTAVLVAAVVYMVLGLLWYGPFFGKLWMKLVGITDKDKSIQKRMSKTSTLSFIGALIMFYILSHFLSFAGAGTWEAGVQGGFWAWLGFVATTGANRYLFAVKPKPWTLYFIEQGYLLAVLMVGGAILAVWK